MILGITGVLLAGGRNTRYPTLKGFIEVAGTTIIQRNLNILKQTFVSLLLSSNDALPYESLDVEIVKDDFVHQGPLAGIHACIKRAGQPIFVLTCDMPFVKEGLVQSICRKFLNSKDYDAVVPVFNNLPQPTIGVYNCTILPFITEVLSAKKNSPQKFLKEIKTLFILQESYHDIDPDGESFININTSEDYEIYIASRFKDNYNLVPPKSCNNQEAGK